MCGSQRRTKVACDEDPSLGRSRFCPSATLRQRHYVEDDSSLAETHQVWKRKGCKAWRIRKRDERTSKEKAWRWSSQTGGYTQARRTSTEEKRSQGRYPQRKRCHRQKGYDRGEESRVEGSSSQSPIRFVESWGPNYRRFRCRGLPIAWIRSRRIRVRAGGLQSNEHEEDEQCEGEEEEKERQRDNEGESGCWPYARHSSFSNEDTVGHWGPSRGSGGVGGGKRRHFEELEDPVSFEGSGTGTFGNEEEEGQEIQKSHEENLKVAGEGVVFKERVVDKEEKEKEEKADVEEWGDRKLQHELIKLLGGIDRGEVRGGARSTFETKVKGKTMKCVFPS